MSETQRRNDTITRSLIDKNEGLFNSRQGILWCPCKCSVELFEWSGMIDHPEFLRNFLDGWFSTSFDTRSWMLWGANYNHGGDRGTIRIPCGQVTVCWCSGLWVLQKHARLVRAPTCQRLSHLIAELGNSQICEPERVTLIRNDLNMRRTISDFRLITLLNIELKILEKLLAKSRRMWRQSDKA